MKDLFKVYSIKWLYNSSKNKFREKLQTEAPNFMKLSSQYMDFFSNNRKIFSSHSSVQKTVCSYFLRFMTRPAKFYLTVCYLFTLAPLDFHLIRSKQYRE